MSWYAAVKGEPFETAATITPDRIAAAVHGLSAVVGDERDPGAAPGPALWPKEYRPLIVRLAAEEGRQGDDLVRDATLRDGEARMGYVVVPLWRRTGDARPRPSRPPAQSKASKLDERSPRMEPLSDDERAQEEEPAAAASADPSVVTGPAPYDAADDDELEED